MQLSLRRDIRRSIVKFKSKIVNKFIILDKTLKEHIIEGSIDFPRTWEKDKFVYPPTIYKLMETDNINFPKKSIDNPDEFIDIWYDSYNIAPSCYNSIIPIDYIFKVKLFFDSFWTFDERIKIPIDFSSRPDEKNKNESSGIIKAFNNSNNNNYPNLVQNQVINLYNSDQSIPKHIKNQFNNSEGAAPICANINENIYITSPPYDNFNNKNLNGV